jgi:iron complex outermembrane receptor protein
VDASLRMNLDRVNPSLKGAYVQLNVNSLTDRKYVAACMAPVIAIGGQNAPCW